VRDLSEREVEYLAFARATLDPKASSFHAALDRFWHQKSRTIGEQGSGGPGGGIPTILPPLRVVRVTGPAGSGKSTFIRRLATGHDLILTPSAKQKETYNDLAFGAHDKPVAVTPELFMFHNAAYAARIFIDEWSLCHPGLIEIASRFSLTGEVIIVGHHEQVLWTPQGYTGPIQFKGGLWDLPINHEVLCRYNYRSNPIIVAAASHFIKTPVEAKRPMPANFPLTIQIMREDKDKPVFHGQYLCYMQADKPRGRGRTVHEAQGEEWDEVTLEQTRRAGANKSTNQDRYHYVGVSRAKDKLHFIVKGKGPTMAPLINAYNAGVALWNELTGGKVPRVDCYQPQEKPQRSAGKKEGIPLPIRRQMGVNKKGKSLPPALLYNQHKKMPNGHYFAGGTERHVDGTPLKGKICIGNCTQRHGSSAA
jgi:hypothetical protein